MTEQRTILKENVDRFIIERANDGKFFTVGFFKKDESFRRMTCKAKVNYRPATIIKRKAGKLSDTPYRNVWATDKLNWRKVNLSTVSYFVFQNKTYWVI